ncbi:uncharacterized protein LOC122511998 [Leptopilina heterotoma]|uniref:uncharacterized protein LOC122511998 n=1 Tax=Leptopilina heterotoma TaxID=63436 RepID=UPI001CA8FEB1|nr:uncharacterized protein LOC122511998 [Leptopilina heterotoma]
MKRSSVPAASKVNHNLPTLATKPKTVCKVPQLDKFAVNKKKKLDYEMENCQKIISKHRVINRTPYEATLSPIKCGLVSINLPRNVADSLDTEEDLEEALKQLNGIDEKENIMVDVENSPIDEKIDVEEQPSKNVNTCNNPLPCGSCGLELNINNSALCTKCNLHMHINCGVLDLTTENSLMCSSCAKGMTIVDSQQDC